MTLLLDVPVAIGLSRAGARGSLDRFEQEQTDFFERVRRAYLDRAAASPDRYRVIDASLPLAQVQEQIDQALQDILDEI
jgi:dTMP kinase